MTGAFYRNDIRDVSKFFANYHYGSFCVVNCCEAQEESGNGNYDPTFLYKQVKKFPMRDHNICPLRTLVVYCEYATQFLNETDDNIIAVHCQGGKGRTGSFCSSLMLWSGLFSNAGEAMAYFARRRTNNALGGKRWSPVAVTSPSQRRCVGYLEEVIKKKIDYITPKYMVLKSLSIKGQPHLSQESCNLTFIVENGGHIEYDHGKAQGLISCNKSKSVNQTWYMTLNTPVLIHHDVQIRFFYFDPSVPMAATVGTSCIVAPGARSIQYGPYTGKQLIFVQFHTAFVKSDELTFFKKELDGAYNKKDSVFAQDFALTVGVDQCATKHDFASPDAEEAIWKAQSSKQHRS